MPSINFSGILTAALGLALGMYLYDTVKTKLPTF